MNKEFKSTQPNEDFNRPSEVIAYASKLVDKKMARAFELFKEIPDRTNESKPQESTK